MGGDARKASGWAASQEICEHPEMWPSKSESMKLVGGKRNLEQRRRDRETKGSKDVALGKKNSKRSRGRFGPRNVGLTQIPETPAGVRGGT